MILRIERYLPSPLALLTFLLTFAYLYIGGTPLLADPDAPWHLAAGKLILSTGALPTADPWSYTAGDQPWYLISWGWNALLGCVHGAFGLKGVFFFVIGLASAVVALMAYALTRRGGLESDALILTFVLGALCLVEYAHARPQLLAYLFIIGFHLLLHESRRCAGSFRTLWPLPLIMVLWVNVHGSVMVGLSLIGAYGLEAMITRRWDWFRRLLAIGILCTLALLVNPYGVHMYTAVMRSLDSVMTAHIIEWMPFVFSSSLGLSVWFLIFICMGVFRDSAIPIADRVISLLWMIAMLFSFRNAAIFVLVSFPALALALQGFLREMDQVRTRREDILAGLHAPGMRLRLAAACVVLIPALFFLLGPIKGDSYRVPKDDIGPMVAYLKTHLAGQRVLNDYGMGGRIIFEAGGVVPIFVDGRAGTVYPERVLSEYLDFLWIKKDWLSLIDRYDIRVIAVKNDHLFTKAYDAGQYREHWKRVYHDEVASIYVRK